MAAVLRAWFGQKCRERRTGRAVALTGVVTLSIYPCRQLPLVCQRGGLSLAPPPFFVGLVATTPTASAGHGAHRKGDQAATALQRIADASRSRSIGVLPVLMTRRLGGTGPRYVTLVDTI